MKTKVVLFDLDATLLPMDQDKYTKFYFDGLVKAGSAYYKDSDKLREGVMRGIGAMVHNDGRMTNEKIFWHTLSLHLGIGKEECLHIFDSFYENEFDKAIQFCTPTQRSREVVQFIKSRGLRVAVATSPVYPRIATEKRIRWAGFSPDEFEFFTTYEDSYYTKPSLGYYSSLLDKLCVGAEECVMVGNDVYDDMPAARLGIQTFLHTDCLINNRGLEYSHYTQGGFDELVEFIKSLS